jgi:N-ethylmaleimide reductase
MHAPGKLFSPFTLGDLHLPNRVVMAPMTRSRAGIGAAPTALNATSYAQRASAGLIIAEGSQICAEGQGYLRTPGIYTPAQTEGWRAVTQAVHARGGRIFLQLWHVGRASHPDNRETGTRAVAPSAIAAPVQIYTAAGLQPAPVPHALSSTDIAQVIAAYAQAARHAVSAGFDGVEIHGANGYLVDQFLQSSSNHRDDFWGGSVNNRCRFLWEVTSACAAAIGNQRVGVRLSPFGVFNGVEDGDPEALFAAAISGLDRIAPAYLHAIRPEVNGDRTTKQTAAHPDIAAFCRRLFKGTLMLAGGFDAPAGEQALLRGDADLIAFGRPFIANPDLVARIQTGAAWAPAERATFYTEGAAGYIDYPCAATGPTPG